MTAIFGQPIEDRGQDVVVAAIGGVETGTSGFAFADRESARGVVTTSGNCLARILDSASALTVAQCPL